MSSADFKSCAKPPMIEDDNLSEHLSRTPLHITLGLGTNYLNMVEAECVKLDTEWALFVDCSQFLDDYQNAVAEEVAAEDLVSDLKDEAESLRCGMTICLAHDSNAARKGVVRRGNDEHEWVIRYREKKKELDAVEVKIKKALNALAAAEKKQTEAQSALMHAAGGIGPFQKGFNDF